MVNKCQHRLGYGRYPSHQSEIRIKTSPLFTQYFTWSLCQFRLLKPLAWGSLPAEQSSKRERSGSPQLFFRYLPVESGRRLGTMLSRPRMPSRHNYQVRYDFASRLFESRHCGWVEPS